MQTSVMSCDRLGSRRQPRYDNLLRRVGNTTRSHSPFLTGKPIQCLDSDENTFTSGTYF